MRDILGKSDMGLTATSDGTWPSYRGVAATTDEQPKVRDTDIENIRSLQDTKLAPGSIDDSDMHRAQTMIHHLGIALKDIYAQGQTNTAHVEAVLALRRDYRASNRELGAMTPKEDRRKRSPSWTLAK